MCYCFICKIEIQIVIRCEWKSNSLLFTHTRRIITGLNENMLCCFNLTLQFDFILHWGDDTSTACRHFAALYVMSWRKKEAAECETDALCFINFIHLFVCSSAWNLFCEYSSAFEQKKVAQKRFLQELFRRNKRGDIEAAWGQSVPS